MSVEVRVPQLGESVVEATVGSWLKREGDQVAAGEPLVQLETEKVNVEVAAERAGVLERIAHQAGDTVAPGDVLATLAEGQSAAPASSAPAADRQAAPAASPLPLGEGQGEGAKMGGAGTAANQGETAPPPFETPSPLPSPRGRGDAGATASPNGPPRVSPEARRLAEERNVDLTKVTGTGPAGRIMAADVEQALAQPAVAPATPSAQPAAPATAPAPIPAAQPQPVRSLPLPSTLNPQPATREQRQRMSRRRQVIAQRLVEAQRTAAMLTTFNEVDMTAVIALRTRRRDAFKERHGVSLGFMSFFTRAAVGALKAFPRLNAEVQGDEIVLKHYYDIGIAVGAEEGLVVPVVRDADRKSFAEIESAIAQLADRARKNTLTLDDLRGGTFTITNGGVFGSLLSTPILNPPQVGILGMHKIEPRPVVVDGQIVARPMMYLALSYDHRIVDGREAVQFLVRIKELVEDPESLLLEA
jgi:2-oxoglutarate dehydrogenase E2 component (dihydrolipoamide succinyltransferase)